MILVLTIDLIVIAVLAYIVTSKGVEAALPFFVFVMVVTPMESAIPLAGLFSLTTQRIALCTLVVLFIAYRPRPQSAMPKSIPLLGLMAVHFFWCIISTANSIGPAASLKKMLAVVIEYYLMYYIVTKTISDVRTIHRIVGAMVLALFVACLFGSIEAYAGWNVSQLFPPSSYRFTFPEAVAEWGRGLRTTGTFGNYSLFGAAIALAVIQALYLLKISKTASRKAFLWLAILLMFLCIYKTASRGPWLTLIMGFALLFPFCSSRIRMRMVVICLLSAMTLIVRPGVYDTINNIVVGSFDTSNPDSQLATSYEYRYALKGVAEDALSRSFTRELWGYGMESFFDLHLKAPFYRDPEYRFESCDSSWIELMVETGYVGLGIIALLLLRPAFYLLRSLRKIPKPERYLGWILLINMLQYYFMMTNVALYAWGQTGYMLWFVIAAGISYTRIKSAETAERHEARQPQELASDFAFS